MSPESKEAEMTKEEFVARFSTRLEELAGPITSEADRTYATQAAEAAWDEPSEREEGPEACAETDYSYWEPL